MMEQTSLNIGTIGQKLETARLAKGVSVSEAGQATKILSKFIKAMEADDFGVLSAPIYARSFIKMYAQYLGLEAQPLVDEFSEKNSSKSVPSPEEVHHNLTQINPPSKESVKDRSMSGQAFVQVISGWLDAWGGKRIVFSAVGALLLTFVVVLSVTQCAGDESESPAASESRIAPRDLISKEIPDAYLVKPGVVEVDK